MSAQPDVMSLPRSDLAKTVASAISPPSRYFHDPDVATESVGDGMVLVHLGRGTTFRLNHTGRLVWELIGAGRTQAEIVAHIEAAWGVAAAQLNSDVASLLQQLLQAKLLQPNVKEGP